MEFPGFDLNTKIITSV